jgi:hypothetical protein
LHRLFEDEPAIVNELAGGESLARLDRDDKHSGDASLKLTPGEKFSTLLPQLAAKIRDNPRLGEYRFLRFAWKKTGAGAVRLHLAADGQWGSDDPGEPLPALRYSAGRAAQSVKTVELDANAPEQWQVIVRDLFSDFGPLQLTGLKLECAGEGTAAFDGIYLGRRREDLDRLDTKTEDPLQRLPKELHASVLVPIPTPNDFARSLTEFAPTFSCSTIGYEGLWLLKEHRGRPRVLRTAPPANDKPCSLRAPVLVPAGKATQLRLSVSHDADRPWKLGVFVNNQPLQEVDVSAATAPGGWLDLTHDLSAFAGQNVLVELRQTSAANVYGYWSRVEVASP